MQGGGASGDVAIGIGFAVNSGVGYRRRRQQVGLEGAIVAAADHPDIAALQPITQRGKDGGLIEAPVRWPIREDQLAPFCRQEGCRRPLG